MNPDSSQENVLVRHRFTGISRGEKVLPPAARLTEDSFTESTPCVHGVDNPPSYAALEPWCGGWLDARKDCSALDMIGDVHGCGAELEDLLKQLDYQVIWDKTGDQKRVRVISPQGRKLVLLGDLVDRGPRVADTLRIAASIVDEHIGYVVIGNHDLRLLRRLAGYKIPMKLSNKSSWGQLNLESAEFRSDVAKFLANLPSYILLDRGQVIASHAGLEKNMIADNSFRTHYFAIFGKYFVDRPSAGEVSGIAKIAAEPMQPEVHWSAQYCGESASLYGHYRIKEPKWANNTLCVDTGCVYGGKLTALRWPERALSSVPSQKAYFVSEFSNRPLPPGNEFYA